MFLILILCFGFLIVLLLCVYLYNFLLFILIDEYIGGICLIIFLKFFNKWLILLLLKLVECIFFIFNVLFV